MTELRQEINQYHDLGDVLRLLAEKRVQCAREKNSSGWDKLQRIFCAVRVSRIDRRENLKKGFLI